MRAKHTYSVTTTGTGKKFEYDGNGNLRYEKQPNGTVIREYRWDQQNRLVRFLQGTHESVYEYDGESHRVRIKELTSSVETKNETFVWCGLGRAARICSEAKWFDRREKLLHRGVRRRVERLLLHPRSSWQHQRGDGEQRDDDRFKARVRSMGQRHRNRLGGVE